VGGVRGILSLHLPHPTVQIPPTDSIHHCNLLTRMEGPSLDDIRNLNFPIFDVRSCEGCGYIKSHNDQDLSNVSFKSTHYTCICNLFADSVICCVDGYENLMLAIPIISIYTNLPVSYSFHMQNSYNADFNIRAARLNDYLVQQCAVVKVIAMNSIPYLSNHVSPIFADDYVCA
jgi:hypothetical protein